MQDWLGITLFALGLVLVAFGFVKRRQRSRTVHPPGSIRPEFAGMTGIVRPLLLWVIGFFAVETCLHYFMLGGRDLMSPLDFAGILFVLASFAAYVLLALTRPVQADGTTSAI
jgi:hypothetical protein